MAEFHAKPWGVALPKMAYEAGGKVTDVLANAGLPSWAAAGLGAATNAGLNFIPSMLMGAKTAEVPMTPDVIAARNARAAQMNSVLEQGRQAGFKVSPSQVNPNIVNRTLESIGGKAATQQSLSAANQDVSYMLAQRESGLDPSQALTPENLAAARETAAAPYREIAKLSPSAAAKLEAWKAANAESRLQWNYFNRQGVPEAFKAATKADTAAGRALQAIEDETTALNVPYLKPELQIARTQIAKIHSVERAMAGSSFDPAALSAQASKGVPMTGGLKTIADMYKDFPKAMARPQIGGAVGVNQLLPLLTGGAGATTGAALGGGAGAGAGAMAGVMAGQALPPAVRGLLLSPAYQSLMANVPQTTAPALGGYGAGLLSSAGASSGGVPDDLTVRIIRGLLSNPQAGRQ